MGGLPCGAVYSAWGECVFAWWGLLYLCWMGLLLGLRSYVSMGWWPRGEPSSSMITGGWVMCDDWV